MVKAKSLAELFALNSPEATKLNMKALVSMPNSGMVRLVYGLEIGLESLLSPEIYCKEDLGSPTGIMLDPGAACVCLLIKFMGKTVDALKV